MKKDNFVGIGRIFLCYLFVFFISAVHAHAQSPAADFLASVAVEEYEQGKREDAIHEFSKVLMIDPHNEKARDYLKRMGLLEGLYQGTKTSETKISELGENVVKYQNQVAELEGQKRELGQKLNKIQAEKGHLKVENALLSVDNQTKDKQVQKTKEQIDSLRGELESREKAQLALAKDTENLTAKQRQSSTDTEAKDLEIHQLNGKINELQKSSASEQDQAKETAFNTDYQDQLRKYSLLNKKYNDLREQLFTKQEENRRMADLVEDYVYVRQNTINELEKQFLAKEVNLTNKEQVYTGRLDELYKMYDNVDQYQQSLSEREEAIEKKNKDIQSLKEKLEQTQKELKDLEKNLNKLSET